MMNPPAKPFFQFSFSSLSLHLPDSRFLREGLVSPIMSSVPLTLVGSSHYARANYGDDFILERDIENVSLVVFAYCVIIIFYCCLAMIICRIINTSPFGYVI